MPRTCLISRTPRTPSSAINPFEEDAEITTRRQQGQTTNKDIATSLKMKYNSTEFFSKNSTQYSYCEEIDYPCENGHICSSASNLNDSVKSYSCNCSKGFASDDKTCENCKFILVLFLY